MQKLKKVKPDSWAQLIAALQKKKKEQEKK